MKTISSAVITRPRYFHSAAMGRSLPEPKLERQVPNVILFLCAHPPPHRCRCRLRVTCRQQQLRLMGLQSSSRLLSARPPHKSSLRQPLLRQPETLAVVGENANRRFPPAAEHEQTSREGILLQLLLAQAGQRVDALSFSRSSAKKKICAVHEYAELLKPRLGKSAPCEALDGA